MTRILSPLRLPVPPSQPLFSIAWQHPTSYGKVRCASARNPIKFYFLKGAEMKNGRPLARLAPFNAQGMQDNFVSLVQVATVQHDPGGITELWCCR